MQHRMKTYQLSQQQIDTLLRNASTGTLATINADGTPYATPVHFVYSAHSVYVHGLPAGQKMDNITANGLVSFTVYEMEKLLLDPQGKPCGTNTQYQSVIIGGTASVLTNIEEKKAALLQLVKKYTPQLKHGEISQNMLNGTAVIKIKIDSITGKYSS